MSHDWQAVELDVTQHYTIDPKDVRHIRKIVDVFMYDKGEVTHCCEITPSYFLIYLYTYTDFRDNTDDARRDEIEQAYCYEPTDDCYMHCRDVDRLASKSLRFDASEEEAREYWQSNRPF